MISTTSHAIPSGTLSALVLSMHANINREDEMKRVISTKTLLTRVRTQYDLCTQCQTTIITLIKTIAKK